MFVTWKAVSHFRPASIRDPAKRANVRNLRRAGAKLRRIGRQKIRRRKRASSAGAPPSAHAPGGSGLKLILYDVDPRRETAIVGPVLFKSRGDPVPGVLEQGGTTEIEVGPREKRVRVPVRIAARPFMGPANEDLAGSGEFLELWGDSV